MCNLYSITANQAAIIALFRVVNRYVGNLPSTTVPGCSTSSGAAPWAATTGRIGLTEIDIERPR
jgi:hypothetical protein